MTVELPKDLDAERAVLNIMKESDTAIHRIAEVLGSTGKHFYDPAHSILYETMVKMEAQGIKLDDNVILHYLSGAESLVPGATLLTLIGGPDRLAEVFSEMHSLESLGIKALSCRPQSGVAQVVLVTFTRPPTSAADSHRSDRRSWSHRSRDRYAADARATDPVRTATPAALRRARNSGSRSAPRGVPRG